MADRHSGPVAHGADLACLLTRGAP